MNDKLRVLFLCTGNSCRSQMAEGWARALNTSLCKFLILRTIRWKPMHGYGIIRQLAAQTRNFCVPT